MAAAQAAQAAAAAEAKRRLDAARSLAATANTRLPESKMVAAARDAVRERIERGRRYYQTAKDDFAAGRFVAAANGFRLALEFDPGNAAIKALVEEATVKAQTQQRDHYLELAKKADEGFREGEAIENLKKALDYDPEAPVYFRVGKWILEKEKDPRRALTLYRKAVEKKPESNEYRLALGDLYAAVKMELNARREYQVVLDRDKKNEKAKAALARLGKG